MMNSSAAIIALRARLLSTVVATTGVTTLGRVGNTFVRATGSFVQDGFLQGMEVLPSGFTNNNPVIVDSVSDLELRVNLVATSEADAPARSLTVGIPSIRGWENIAYQRVDHRWSIEEDYIPGTAPYRVNVSNRGQFQHEPTYVIRLVGLAGRGFRAMHTVSDAILNRFAPGLALAQPDGQPLRVKGDPAPYKGMILTEDASHSVIVITIPLWKRTFNMTEEPDD